MQQYGLGRGLSSLIPQKKSTSGSSFQKKPMAYDEDAPAAVSAAGKPHEVEIARIRPNTHQPRTRFNEEKLRELADSIRQHGIIQPLVVTDRDRDGVYELIAGERRLRAAKMAGLAKVPIIFRATTGGEKLELAILENIQRHDLNPMEEARAYNRLGEEFGLSQEETAKKLGKSRSAVANVLRLLRLPVEIQRALEEETITEGHAKAILAIDNPEKQRALFEVIVKEKLTVREAEEKARSVSVRPHTRTLSQDPQLKSIEDEMSEVLGTKVAVQKNRTGARVVIECYSRDELVGLLNKIR